MTIVQPEAPNSSARQLNLATNTLVRFPANSHQWLDTESRVARLRGTVSLADMQEAGGVISLGIGVSGNLRCLYLFMGGFLCIVDHNGNFERKSDLSPLRSAFVMTMNVKRPIHEEIIRDESSVFKRNQFSGWELKRLLGWIQNRFITDPEKPHALRIDVLADKVVMTPPGNFAVGKPLNPTNRTIKEVDDKPHSGIGLFLVGFYDPALQRSNDPATRFFFQGVKVMPTGEGADGGIINDLIIREVSYIMIAAADSVVTLDPTYYDRAPSPSSTHQKPTRTR